MMQLRTAWRLGVLAFAVSCILLLAVGWTSYRRLADLRDANARADHARDVRIGLGTVLSLLQDAETGQRGFLITGEPSYLEPYRAALASLPLRSARLRQLTADNPGQQARLAALDTLIQQKSSELNTTIVARGTGGVGAAARIVLTDEGKRVMDRIRAVIDAMQAEEKRLLSERIAQEEGAARVAVATTVGGLALAFALVLVATVLLSLAVRARERAHAARTEAEATARAIAGSEERLRVTLSSIGDAVIATDGEGRVTLMNEVAQELTGWRMSDGAGKRLEEIFVILNEDTRRPVENPVSRVVRERMVTGLANHTVLIAKDGREISIDDSAAPIRAVDGSLLGVVMVFRDITERRQIERQHAVLLQQERQARTAIERTAARLRHVQAITDAALLNLGFDDLARALLARIRAALASDTATILLLDPTERELTPVASDGLGEEVDAGVRIPVGRGAAGRIAASEDGLVIDDLGGIEIVSPWLRERVKSLAGVPLRIEGRLIGVVHVGAAEPGRFAEADLELLRLVAARAALAVERARLHQAAQSARALAEAASRQAEAADRAKDEFLAVLSHELRSPLTTMVGWIRMLLTGRLDPSQQKRALDAIDRSTRTQARMIDDLLDVSRIVAGKMTLERRPLHLAPLIVESLETLQHETNAKGLTMQTRLDPGAGMVAADPDRIRQILMNLLTNALKYTPSGGGVEVQLAAEGGVVRVVVTDTGIGIERELLPHVFERFRQADSRAAGTRGGLGLGLAIVREIVEMHGGTVEARSDGPGHGAAFVLTLPRHT